MNLRLDTFTEKDYTNTRQTIRVITERWFVENMFCPNCGLEHISKMPNNSKVADAFCPSCKEIFELKSKNGKPSRIIPDGEYSTAISRLNSNSNPDLFVLHYTNLFCVSDLTVVPKFFFVPKVLKKRKPLGPNARRAGWTGCNIIYGDIPEQGKIDIVKDGQVLEREQIIEKYNSSKRKRAA